MFLNKKRKIVFIILLVIGFLFFINNKIYALKLEINYPHVPGDNTPPPQEFINTASPENILPLYVKYIFNFFVWISGILFLLFFVYGGVKYLTAGGNTTQIREAKNQMISSFLGILIILSSVTILNLINPKLTILTISQIEKKEPNTTSISPYPSTDVSSLTETPIPLGDIIQRGIFEGSVPCSSCNIYYWPLNSCNKLKCDLIGNWCVFKNGNCQAIRDSRLTRIKKEVSRIKELIKELRQKSAKLKDLSEECECEMTMCTTSTPSGCTCDPCLIVREGIQQTEEDIFNLIYLGADSLIQTEERIENEVFLLKQQLNRLQSAEKFLINCADLVNNMASFLIKKSDFEREGKPLRKAFFYDDIFDRDWMTFYCPVSGLIKGTEQYSSSILEVSTEDITKTEQLGYSTKQEKGMSCPSEIHIGEIIDRSKRVANTLIDRMKKINQLSKELIKEIDELQQLISQCSSQRCYCDDGECEGDPCPDDDISNKEKEIEDTCQKLIDIIENDKDTADKIGIEKILNEIIPGLIEDLKINREKMKNCAEEMPEDKEGSLNKSLFFSDCNLSKGATGGDDKYNMEIKNCCLNEKEFQECLKECYLKSGDNYLKCLYDCKQNKAEELRSKGEEDKAEIIESCKHKINFFCCQGY